MSKLLTFEEAQKIAHQLYEIELLSKKGERTLLRYIKEEKRAKKRLEENFILSSLDSFFYSALNYRMDKFTAVRQIKYNTREQEIKNKKISDEEETKLIQQLDEEFEKEVVHHKVEKTISNDEIKGKIQSEEITSWWRMSYLSISEDLIHKNRSVVGKTSVRTLYDLFKLKLIDELVFEDAKKKVNEEVVILEHELCNYALVKIYFYKKYKKYQKVQLKLLDRLEEGGVISVSNKEKLINSQQKIKLTKLYEIIPYCNNAKIFRVKDYSTDLEKNYRIAFEEIKKIVSSFKPKNLTVFVEESYYEGWSSTRSMIISFEANSVCYNYSFSIYEYNNEKDIDFYLNQSSLKHIINKFLIEQNSEYRIYSVSSFYEEVYGEKFYEKNYVTDESEFGFIVLTQKQRNLWKENGKDIQPYLLSDENHSNQFNTKNIEKIIKEYENIGLFSHVSAEEIEKSKYKISQEEINDYRDILCLLPKQVASIYWGKWIYIDRAKECFIESFSEASRGKISIEQIEKYLEKEHKKAKGNIFADRKTYQTVFLRAIKKILKEDTNEDLHLHQIAKENYIFLSKSQYEYLNKNQPKLFSSN